MGFFYSPQDWRSGWNTGPNYVYYGNPVDRRAHGDIPFVEWYLQQFAAASRRANRRLLDYLDLHGYIAPDEVQFKSAGDTVLQQMRLDAVRAFWDPSYHVAGGINDQPFLVPRMRDWVARNYPGTLTAITEYNLGALDHINGAIAQADLLGVFGREGLDLAAIWAPPSEAEPGLYSFKIFRNYDDGGNGFGDVSVRAASADQSRLSVYAARAIDRRSRADDSRVEQVVRRPVEHDCGARVQRAERGRGVSLRQLERRPNRAAAGSARGQDVHGDVPGHVDDAARAPPRVSDSPL